MRKTKEKVQFVKKTGLLLFLLTALGTTSLYGCSNQKEAETTESETAGTMQEEEKKEEEKEEIYSYKLENQYDFDGSFWDKNEYVYDDNENLIEKRTYSENNSLIRRIAYEYNEMEDEIKATTYNAEGNVVTCTETELSYDENGNCTEKIVRKDGVPEEWAEMEYDGNDKIVKKITFEPDGTIFYTAEYEYNENGDLLRESSNYENGEKYYMKEMTYDESGSTKKETYYREGKVDGVYISVYDENHNQIRFEERDANNTCVYSAVSEYDEKGNEIKYTLYGQDNQIVCWHEYEYDEKGNDVKSTQYNNAGDMIECYQSVYEYDESGELVSVKVYYSDREYSDVLIQEEFYSDKSFFE